MKVLSEFTLLNIGNLICCLGLSLIAPFYPTYAEQFDVSGSLLGLIFGINPIGGIMSSLIVGKILNKNNQANLLSLGMLIQSIGMFCYPLLTFTTDRTMFITISLLGRFISGFGAQTFVTPLYAIITQRYADSINQKMATTEFFSSFGYLCGPVIGSTLYSLGGFSFPFILFACFSVIIAIILKLKFEKQEKQEKKAINEVNEPVISDEYDIYCSSKSLINDEDIDVQIGYFDLIKYFPVSSSLFVMLALCITFTFYYPTYAIYFEENFNIPPQHVGFYMSAVSLAYSIGALTISRISVNKSKAIFIGMVFVSISQFFMGPDPIMNISPKIIITVIVKLIEIYKIYERIIIIFNQYNNILLKFNAQSIFGFFSAPPYIMALPKITEELSERFKKSDHDKCIIDININCCNSLASGLFNAVISTGDFLGPVFSGAMAEFFSFQRSCSFLGLYLVATTLLFLPNLFISKKIQPIQIQTYKEYL